MSSSWGSQCRHWNIATGIHFLRNFGSSKTYPTIIAFHSIGGCQKQTSANVYAPALVEAECVVIAFDAIFRRVNGGRPRFRDIPSQCIEDFERVVD